MNIVVKMVMKRKYETRIFTKFRLKAIFRIIAKVHTL